MFSILVPVDGSAYAERAIPITKRLAQASQGTIVLLRVVDPLVTPQSATSAAFTKAEFTEASRYVTSLVHTEEPDNVSMETMVLGGPSASLILSGACLAHTDLINLCRHGYADAKGYSIGSVAEKVIWQSAHPVLVLGEADPLPGMLTSGDTQPMCILVPLDGSAHAKAALIPVAQLIAALSYPAREGRLWGIGGVTKRVLLGTKMPAFVVRAQAHEIGPGVALQEDG